jgi:hypothetical protein
MEEAAKRQSLKAALSQTQVLSFTFRCTTAAGNVADVDANTIPQRTKMSYIE